MYTYFGEICIRLRQSMYIHKVNDGKFVNRKVLASLIKTQQSQGIKFMYSEKAKRNSKPTHLGVDRLETPLQFQIGVDLFICVNLVITFEIIFELFFSKLVGNSSKSGNIQRCINLMSNHLDFLYLTTLFSQTLTKND